MLKKMLVLWPGLCEILADGLSQRGGGHQDGHQPLQGGHPRPLHVQVCRLLQATRATRGEYSDSADQRETGQRAIF
jgi:hypothetical protein